MQIHELTLTVDLGFDGAFQVKITDPETGIRRTYDHAISFDNHEKFDKTIGDAIYEWIRKWSEPSGAINLGTFELTTPVMRVSDPCYEKDTWCAGEVDNCRPGTWEAATMKLDQGLWGVRNASIAVRFSESSTTFEDIFESWEDGRVEAKMDGWDICPFEVGVDSGQAGFFDDAKYHDNSIFDGRPAPKHNFGDRWYNECCDMTLTPVGAGIIPFGAVTSSGYGDGGYSAYKHTNAEGIVDAMLIIFIDDDEDDDEDDD